MARGFVLKESFREARAVSAVAAAQFDARIPHETRAAVDATSALAWTEFRHNIAVMKVCREILTPAERSAYYKRVAGAGLKNPFLRGGLDFFIKISGATPKSFAKSIPTLWTLLMKDCGQWVFEPSDLPQEARLRWENLPPEALDPHVIEAYGFGHHAFFDLSKTVGTSESQLDTKKRMATYRLVWR